MTTYTAVEKNGKIIVMEKGYRLVSQFNAQYVRKNFNRMYRDLNNKVLEFPSIEYAQDWCITKAEIMAIINTRIRFH